MIYDDELHQSFEKLRRGYFIMEMVYKVYVSILCGLFCYMFFCLFRINWIWRNRVGAVLCGIMCVCLISVTIWFWQQ
jgi:hypothetical protein